LRFLFGLLLLLACFLAFGFDVKVRQPSDYLVVMPTANDIHIFV
jgi:hypothetical protein